MADTENETGDEAGGLLPQPTEEVHLPGPSYLPAIVAFSTMGVLVGIVNVWPLAVISGIILVYAILRWIGQAREEMRQLPLEH
jgi:hypothetical protein